MTAEDMGTKRDEAESTRQRRTVEESARYTLSNIGGNFCGEGPQTRGKSAKFSMEKERGKGVGRRSETTTHGREGHAA